MVTVLSSTRGRRAVLAALTVGLMLAFAGCGGGGGGSKGSKKASSTGPNSGTSGTGSDTTRPTVTGISPGSGAASVALTSTVTVTFSEAINVPSVTTSAFTLTPQGGSPVAATISASGNTATLTPTAALSAGTAYTVSLSTDITDLAGNALIAYSATFTTVASSGPGTHPTVTSVTPSNGTGGAAISTAITVTFSAPMDGTTLTTSTFTLTPSGGSAVGATISFDGNETAVLTPSSALMAGTAYTVGLTSGVKDTDGQTLVPFQSSFSTAAVSGTPPHVTLITPANGDTDIAIGQTVQATFNVPVTFSALNESTFQVQATDESTPVPGTVLYDSATLTATFTADAPFGYSKTYQVTLGTGITDGTGVTLTTFTSSFTTTSVADLTAPVVSSTSPADGDINVATDKQITALFSEPLQPASVNATTFLVNGGNIAGTVTYNSATNTALFAPTAGLTAGTSYTVTLETGIQDLSGNALAAPYTWNFATVSAADTTPPTVISTTPADGDATISSGLSAVTATFSEALNAGTVNALSFTLANVTDSANPVPVGGTVTYDATSHKAIFTVAGSLAASTPYQANLSTSITDLAGNALATPNTWSFTTAAASEVIAPGVTQTVEPDGSTQVGVDFSGLDSTQIASAVDSLQSLLDGTLTTSGPLNVTITGDPDNPLSLSVPLIIRRSDVNLTVTPSGTVTLDGYDATDTSGNLINNIVQVSGSNVTLDGVNVVNGDVSLITQLGIPTEGVSLKNMVLHDAVSGNCIELHHCSDCTIENVQAYRCFKKGMDISDVTNLTVRNVTIGVGAVDQGPITCNPDDDTQYPTCMFGSNGPRAFAEISKSNGGLIDGLTIYASRSGSGGTGNSAPGGSTAFGNGLLLSQNSGAFTLKNIVIRDSVLAPVGSAPHGMISVWNHTTPSAITIDNVTILGNASKAFSFGDKSGVHPSITVTNSTVSGNAGGIVESLTGFINCAFSGDTLDGDPSSTCSVSP